RRDRLVRVAACMDYTAVWLPWEHTHTDVCRDCTDLCRDCSAVAAVPSPLCSADTGKARVRTCAWHGTWFVRPRSRHLHGDHLPSSLVGDGSKVADGAVRDAKDPPHRSPGSKPFGRRGDPPRAGPDALRRPQPLSSQRKHLTGIILRI